MLGIKINEFDNSDGTIKSFNKIFPMTQLKGEGDVEILDIVDSGNFSNNLYMRNVEVNGKSRKHDFGESNFYDSSGFNMEENVRFKYSARNLEGTLLATAYNQADLAKKLECHINIIKRRLIDTVNSSSGSKYLFNVSRVDV